MKRNITFNYCKDFKCIGNNCKHNCCEKWQIDIDGKTLNKYSSYIETHSDGLTERFRNGVDFSNRRFIMNNVNGKVRCSFLNGDNLCDLISGLGEKYLCRTCKVHPRFKNFLPDRIETGVSLACEEGARKLLSYPEKIEATDKTDCKTEDKFLSYKFKARKKALKIVQNRAVDINKRISDLLTFFKINRDRFFGLDYKTILKNLNILDNGWKKRIDKIDIKDIIIDKEYSVMAENLSVYFLLKYLLRAKDKIDVSARVGLSVFGTLAIFSVFIREGNLSLEGITDIAREYSAEIEYDDENTENLISEIEDTVLIGEI